MAAAWPHSQHAPAVLQQAPCCLACRNAPVEGRTLWPEDCLQCLRHQVQARQPPRLCSESLEWALEAVLAWHVFLDALHSLPELRLQLCCQGGLPPSYAALAKLSCMAGWHPMHLPGLLSPYVCAWAWAAVTLGMGTGCCHSMHVQGLLSPAIEHLGACSAQAASFGPTPLLPPLCLETGALHTAPSVPAEASQPWWACFRPQGVSHPAAVTVPKT